MVLPPPQVFRAEYLANDSVRVVQVAYGHVHFAYHAQLLARHFGQVGVLSDGERVGVARRRAVRPVQLEVVLGTGPLQPGRRVRPVALVRRTVVPVRVDFRVQCLDCDRRGARKTTAPGRRQLVDGHDGHGHRSRVRIIYGHHASRAASAARAALSSRRLCPQVVHGSRTTHPASMKSFTQRLSTANSFFCLIPRKKDEHGKFNATTVGKHTRELF